MNDIIRKIHVNASLQYDILIGPGLLKSAGELVSQLNPGKHLVIVSDDNVYPIYGEMLKESLKEQGIETVKFVFPHGEHSKSMEVFEKLLEFMCENHITRSDMVAALGGGVTGDMAGFAAAVYQRGIRYVQIPTSLLACVDSSVGGKTAINLKGGKNQAGCFYQPSLVICDTDTLKTLPEKEYKNGCAEIIKYGMIRDEKFLKEIGRRHIKEWQTDVIAKCVEMKRDVVAADEFDKGERMILNFGHTFGHGVEKCSAFNVPHGFAVAQGMAEITKSAQKKGICPEGTYEELVEILEKYALESKITFPAQDIIAASAADKKSTGSTIRIIVPEKAGNCVIKEIRTEELKDWLEA